MKKALFINHKDGELDASLFARMSKNFDQTEFCQRDDPQILSKVKDADAFFVKISTKVDKELIDAAPNLKYVGVCSTAFDAIDAKYARGKGVTVCNLGGYSSEAVAEFFFAALFEKTRDLEQAKNQARKEDYSFSNFMGLELQNKTLGVIGAGAIGSRVAEIGCGIGMNVVYFSRKNKTKIEQLGASKKSLDEVLQQSDFISVNLSLNAETKGILSQEKLALVKKGAILINLAPPPLIDQETIMKKAAQGELTFIFDHSDDIDPALTKQFLNTKNCIVYPPIAFRTTQANINRWETFAANIEKFISGTPQNVVN